MRAHFIKAPFGVLDCYQMVLLISAHTNRHMQQLNEVKTDPNFSEAIIFFNSCNVSVSKLACSIVESVINMSYKFIGPVLQTILYDDDAFFNKFI